MISIALEAAASAALEPIVDTTLMYNAFHSKGFKPAFPALAFTSLTDKVTFVRPVTVAAVTGVVKASSLEN